MQRYVGSERNHQREDGLYQDQAVCLVGFTSGLEMDMGRYVLHPEGQFSGAFRGHQLNVQMVQECSAMLRVPGRSGLGHLELGEKETQRIAEMPLADSRLDVAGNDCAIRLSFLHQRMGVRLHKRKLGIPIVDDAWNFPGRSLNL